MSERNRSSDRRVEASASLLLLHGGAGHADDEEQDEGAHEGQGVGLGQREERRDHLLPDGQLAQRRCPPGSTRR